MSRYFGVVDDLAYIRSMGDTKPETTIAEPDHIESRLCHIIAEVLAVGTGICNELALIERLRIVKCLLGSIAEFLVCFSLECSQVIEFRCFFGLDLTLDR